MAKASMGMRRPSCSRRRSLARAPQHFKILTRSPQLRPWYLSHRNLPQQIQLLGPLERHYQRRMTCCVMLRCA